MKKRVFVLTMILLLSLLATSTVMADGDSELPSWDEVFNDEAPFTGWYEADDTGLEFKGQLYFKFFGEDIVDQAWSTTDGESWSLAWEATSIDPEFEYFWPMIVFQDQLYLVLRDGDGVFGDRITRTPDGHNWETVFIAESTEEQWVWFDRFMLFDGQLYIFSGRWEGESYSEHLLRSPSGDLGTWNEVAQFPCGARAFEAFKGAMYIGGEWCEGGAPIWRSLDGVIWELITPDGFGYESNLTVDDFVERGGNLYVDFFNLDGGQIWHTQDGMNWTSVTTDGFEDPNNLMFTFINYKENMYAFSFNGVEGSKVYSSKDGESWYPANEPGWGDVTNVLVYNTAMVVYKNALYVSPEGPAGILKFVEP
jgi:hypothetical protein